MRFVIMSAFAATSILLGIRREGIVMFGTFQVVVIITIFISASEINVLHLCFVPINIGRPGPPPCGLGMGLGLGKGGEGIFFLLVITAATAAAARNVIVEPIILVGISVLVVGRHGRYVVL